MTQANILDKTYYARKTALYYLQVLYDAIAVTLQKGPSCGECCVRSTPVVSYVEAEYIREGLVQFPGVKKEVLRRCSIWLGQAIGDRTKAAFDAFPHSLVAMQAQVYELRRTSCPFLKADSSCLIEPFQPLECRVHEIPSGARQPVHKMVERIFKVYPQHTGFLPTQLYALSRPEELAARASKLALADAMLARGTMEPLVR